MPTRADKKRGFKLTEEQYNKKTTITEGERDNLVTDHYILIVLKSFETFYKDYLLGKVDIDGVRGFEEALEIAKNVSHILSEEFAANYKQEIINNLNNKIK